MYRMLSTDFHLLNCLLLFLGPTGNNYQESEKFVLYVQGNFKICYEILKYAMLSGAEI